MRRHLPGLFLAFLLPFAAAQETLTTTDAVGQTIIEVITVGDLDGLPTTSTISTVLPTGVTTTLTTTDALGQTVVEVITGDGAGVTATQTIQTIPAGVETPDDPGPVGQPGATGAAGALTPFTYTTTDANGITTAVVATFTPSFATTVMPSATFKATVMAYSDYTATYATAAVTQNANANNSNNGTRPSGSWWGPCLGALISMVGGTILLLGA
ncbi:hypothetical protein C8R43DRAFT_468698 [Mycena crocata]|nr:hypothetical protein C8R43DRAFT_468698 [Mycena crocata]